VRSVCFTGSVPVGTALAKELAEDYSKSLALELGGVNSLMVCADADLDAAAAAAADGMCLTTGQRCNATSRILVDRGVEEEFAKKLHLSLGRYEPGDPLLESTMLGPLISAAAVERHQKFGGEAVPSVKGKAGHFVKPMVLRTTEGSLFGKREAFCPVAEMRGFSSLDEAAALQGDLLFGLTASIFTSSGEVFRELGDKLEVGNLYHNLPTTFSPSTLPFGGWRASGNGRPGGRGFIRFAVEEQAVQWRSPMTKT